MSDPRDAGPTADPHASSSGTTSPSGPPPRTPADPVVPRTRTGAIWVASAATVLLLLMLVIFIAQNGQQVEVRFLWLEGEFSLAVALLAAAVMGALLVVLAGTARIIQLRLVARRNRGLPAR
jgi:uncharacterized integral membrane protein